MGFAVLGFFIIGVLILFKVQSKDEYTNYLNALKAIDRLKITDEYGVDRAEIRKELRNTINKKFLDGKL